MRRRDLIMLLGTTVMMSAQGTVAQDRPMPVIGFLGIRSPAETAHLVAAFRQGLDQTGHVEGRNVAIEYRWAENQYDRLPALAADLVRRQVNVIAATGGGVSARAAKAATPTIPIVFVAGDLDPVDSGLVSSLNRPGGNITGITPFTSVLGPKRLELLHEMVPKATVIGMLLNPNFADAETQSREAREAARTLGLQLDILNASSEPDFDTAFSTFVKQQTEALLVANDALFLGRREQLVALAARYALPAIYSYREYVTAGGLMSYAPSLADGYRQAGGYTGRILKGEKPADLPVQQPTRFELVVNLKTAKALGLEAPAMLLALADEVIE
jgi:putative tryptophan/tyrosine transport system substrate-binding protein